MNRITQSKADVLKEVTDRRKVMTEKNVSTELDNTAHDIQEEARDDNGGDDAEKDDDNEDKEHGEGVTASGVQRKRRQEHNFYFTTEPVDREDTFEGGWYSYCNI